MLDLKRNNLDKSSSPYLRQHAGNPVWWQEWSSDILKVVIQQQKPIFASGGYATCHWCHVMAADAFSDKTTAEYLNGHFICIKIDREVRPDIDQFLMQFAIALNGSGGWPLNVFLSPDIHPIFALTYAPAHTSDTMPSFLEICKKVYEYYRIHKGKIKPFKAFEPPPPIIEESKILRNLLSYFDFTDGGFGLGQKFPPHTTLLYLLYFLCSNNNKEVRNICITTLDSMRLRGLHDHLQGGIYRYCVDKKWNIPHFEKMLYDQAMGLWCYALAYKVFGKKEYKNMAEDFFLCLETCFKDDGLYISAFDADTEHVEGGTYIWKYEELKQLLSVEEFNRFTGTYFIYPEGNFEGNIHLVRRNDSQINDIEKKLLTIRNRRKQPDKDKKILCGINALVAIAMLQMGRLIGKNEPAIEAKKVIERIIDKFWDGKNLAHSFSNGKLQRQAFLFDCASLLLALSMLYENDRSWKIQMEEMYKYVESFQERKKWIEARPNDFQTIEASWIDHPIPSSVSLAEMGLTRTKLFTGKDVLPSSYRQSFQADFFNINVMIQKGLFHHYITRKAMKWDQLPANSIQMRGKTETDCYQGICRSFSLKKVRRE